MLISCLSGATAGGFFATSIGDKRSFKLDGWRIVFLATASASILSGILVLLLASDPRKVRATCTSSPSLVTYCRLMQAYLSFCRILISSQLVQESSTLLAVRSRT